MVKDLVELEDSDAPIVQASRGLTVFRPPARPSLPVAEVLQSAISMGSTERELWHNRQPVLEVFIETLSGFAGASWQERWDNSGAESLIDSAGAWADVFPGLDERARANYTGPGLALSLMIRLDTLRPSAPFLIRNGRVRLHGFVPWSTGTFEDSSRDAVRAVDIIRATTGKHLEEITVDDLIALIHIGDKPTRAGATRAWEIFKTTGLASPDAPGLRQLARGSRPDAAGIVAFYRIEPPEVHEMFVRYLRSRQASVDYSTIRNVAYELLRNFWNRIREQNPNQRDLHIDPELGRWWKQRMAEERADLHRTLFVVRALYLDIASWATHDAYWATWAAPTFILQQDTVGSVKAKRRVQAEIHQRIRHFTPDLPRLMDSVDREMSIQGALLEAALATPADSEFTFMGETYLRMGRAPRGRSVNRIPIRNARTGEVVLQANVEDYAFWAWAVVHILQETGIRLEELMELTATALFTYKSNTGERLLLLQIVPSKTDRERVLLVSPELAHVLAAVRQRIRGKGDRVPLAVRYDPLERQYSPPLPFLMQSPWQGTNSVFSHSTIRNFIRQAIRVAGFEEHVSITPHDFRRLFATDALRSGLPVHILSKVMGHLNINTTQGYAAVFDDDVVRHFRSFVDRRRALRPAEDYREPTASELEEFQAHFAKRKVELGSCSRGYGTPCIHEHACIRCPLLRPDPRQRHRLEEIRANLLERRSEAQQKGWLGELEGIEISIRAAEDKLSQMTRIVRLTLERRHPTE